MSFVSLFLFFRRRHSSILNCQNFNTSDLILPSLSITTRLLIKVHAMGLRFQLRMERGISIEAVQQRTKVFGTTYTADEIVDWNRSCGKVRTHD